MKHCINCGKNRSKRSKKYCSNTCQDLYQHKQKVESWLNGNHNGMRGQTSTATFIKRYLIETRGNCCEKCGWNKINPYTNNVPIELNHIDGNFRNNSIDNLELLCPSCHSLTKTYKSLNNGNGRPR